MVLSSLAAGFGAGGLFTADLRMFATVSALALITWMAWAVLMHQIGTRMLPEPQTEATLGQLLRTVGFAAAPGLLQVFAIFPVVTIPVFVGTSPGCSPPWSSACATPSITAARGARSRCAASPFR